MIDRNEQIEIEQELFSTKIVTEQPKKSMRDRFVEFDNSVWQKGQTINFLGIEGVKLLPSDDWIEGESEFYTINFLKNVGNTIRELVKNEDNNVFFDEQEAGYIVEFSDAPQMEDTSSTDFNSQFDAAPEKFDPFIK